MEKSAKIERETKEIVRVHLDRGEIKTCVFFVKNGEDFILIDCGLDEETTEKQLLPAMQAPGISPLSVRYLLITHTHFDHIGGFPSLLPHIPNAEVFAYRKFSNDVLPLADGMRIGALRSVALFGHTDDSFGFLDERTNSLLSGDAVQLWGIGDYGVNAEEPKAYLATHEKLLKMPIENIFSSHAYDFLGIRAVGNAACRAYIRESEENYKTLIRFVQENLATCKTAESLCAAFAKSRENHPKMQPCAIKCIIKSMNE